MPFPSRTRRRLEIFEPKQSISPPVRLTRAGEAHLCMYNVAQHLTASHLHVPGTTNHSETPMYSTAIILRTCLESTGCAAPDAVINWPPALRLSSGHTIGPLVALTGCTLSLR
jgi:hypothetical protein